MTTLGTKVAELIDRVSQVRNEQELNALLAVEGFLRTPFGWVKGSDEAEQKLLRDTFGQHDHIVGERVYYCVGHGGKPDHLLFKEHNAAARSAALDFETHSNTPLMPPTQDIYDAGFTMGERLAKVGNKHEHMKTVRDWKRGGPASPLWAFVAEFIEDQMGTTEEMAEKTADLFMEQWTAPSDARKT